ncbi:Elongation factor Tu GTP-binding domain-containing protein 1 [Fasciola gigantica]|uniref:Elongation factor Tu GTP-binding domain-containing protein 1 n=1 Tax=Fasciola gigantica TaxID=46835 RepID=A0A504YG97_FASGI|nr:Elongation factor Tu GTP-binding domain-containing protein 1 [Fasciola gigantica]
MNRACLAAFQASLGQRLLLAVYDVELQARPEVLGRMFAVLRKRHGHVVNEDFREGENLFIVNARLPVIESFGLADELRSRTNGIVSLPQLRPGGWELLDIDPTQRDLLFDGAGAKGCVVGVRNDSNIASANLKRGGKKTVGFGDTNTTSYPRHNEPFSTSGKAKKTAITDSSGGRGVSNNGDEEPVDEQIAQQVRLQRYLRDVRLRKGLSTNEQLVLFADKQRTLKKNK